MIDINELRQSLGAVQPEEVAELLDRLEAAEKERDTLRTRIEAMEKQEPAAFGLYSGWALKATYLKEHEACEQRDRRQLTADLAGSLEAYRVSPLYALPGAQAQPAQSAPDGWKLVLGGWLSVPEKHPTFYPVDLRLSDGSVLCGCLPQAEGDYWWGGLNGRVFIDPKYAPVTHWRLAATPEAKP